MREIDRRLRALEEPRTLNLTDEVIQFISDEDLEWLVALPTNAAGTSFDVSHFSPEQCARSDAITVAAFKAAGVRMWA